jgi:hypothetical protein
MTVTGELGLRAAGGSAARAGVATKSDTRHGVTRRLRNQNLNIFGSIAIRMRHSFLASPRPSRLPFMHAK